MRSSTRYWLFIALTTIMMISWLVNREVQLIVLASAFLVTANMLAMEERLMKLINEWREQS